MATVADYVRYQPSADLKTFQVRISKPTDQITKQLVNKFVKDQVWAGDVTTPDSENDDALFKLYEFEKIGIVTSKIELKNEKRYERKFYLTELGKTLLSQ